MTEENPQPTTQPPVTQQPVIQQPTTQTPMQPHYAAGVTPHLRLPTFWRADPDLWFCQAEMVFATSRITSSKVKFQLVVPQLEFEISKQVSDIIKNPPDLPYEALKTRLVGIFSETENQRIKRVLEDKKLADGERPSHFLNDLKRLTGTTFSADLIRHIFLRALPERIQATLAVTSETDVDKLATLADQIAEVYESSLSQTSAAHLSPSKVTDSQNIVEPMERLQEAVQQLSLEVSELKAQHRRARSSSRTRGRSRSSHQGRKLCYYHDRFGKHAKKCQQPCDWKPEPPKKTPTDPGN